jgi:hypothetical protein
MKHLIKYFTLLLLLSLSNLSIPYNKASAQGAEVSFQIFYDQLSPYGHWVNFPDEGYVWIPDNQSGFAPYQSNGYWVFTDYGWTWVSDYQWGWAPFHYGRWDFDDDYGWYWVPEYEWAPAWVAWSRAPGYYGWAPLRPGIEINDAITSGYYAPPEHWCYVHEEFLGRRDMDKHFTPRSENNIHIRNSEMINKTYIDNERHTTYAGGPTREEVQKSTGAPIQQLQIVPRSSPGQSIAGNQISIYKPVVVRKTKEPAPPKLESIKDIKPLPGRSPNPERINAASQSAQTQQTQQKASTVNPTTPPTRQNEKTNTQAAPDRNITPPQRQQPPAQSQQQQPPPQQNAPPQQSRQQQPTTQQPATSRQQQAAPPKYQRENRYAPPAYQAPRPSNPPVQQQRQNVPPIQPPHAEQPHSSPPQNAQQPHGQPQQGQPKQDGKPH